MQNLTGTNKKTLFVVYNEEKYNNTGEVDIIQETENLFVAQKLVKHNKSLNYSSYPPYCYDKNKK